uniref:Ig-like domain-containing protein n=1 Tax=Acanthochromis polyacanthus TaxID=80966 RepID=A0A3Q1F3B9_9TELE
MGQGRLACTALPVTFKQSLESQEAEEGNSVTLCCELSKPGVPVEWKKGTQVLKSGEKYQMKQKASVNELVINKVLPEDSGDYNCVCGDQKTTASIKIKGRRRIFKDLVPVMFFKTCMKEFFICHSCECFMSKFSSLCCESTG